VRLAGEHCAALYAARTAHRAVPTCVSAACNQPDTDYFTPYQATKFMHNTCVIDRSLRLRSPNPIALLSRSLAACLALLCCETLALAQQDFSKVEIKATKVAGNVYMLEGSGGNIGVSVGDDGIVIVDDQFAPLAPKIKAALKEITDKPLRFVLNTHFHGDHTGGNIEFGKDATIIAHENVRKRLQDGGNVGGTAIPSAPKQALPVITFNDRATVHLNGEDIRAIHFPHGHTDGDSVIFFPKSNVVHMGDDFVTYGFPFIDVRSGGSLSGMIADLEKVLTLIPSDAKVIPGHGPLSTPDDVRKFADMLKDTRALVAKASAEGKTADQMKTDHVLSKYESLGKGFIKTDAWIDLVLADVQQNPAAAPGYQPHGHADEQSK
jgi:cyclase